MSTQQPQSYNSKLDDVCSTGRRLVELRQIARELFGPNAHDPAFQTRSVQRRLDRVLHDLMWHFDRAVDRAAGAPEFPPPLPKG